MMWDFPSPPAPSSGTPELITAQAGLGSPSTRLPGHLTQENGTCLWKKIEALTSSCAFGMKFKTHFSWMRRENKYIQQQFSPKRPIGFLLLIFLGAHYIYETNHSYKNWLDGCFFFQILLFRYNCRKHSFNNLSYVTMHQRGASFRKGK